MAQHVGGAPPPDGPPTLFHAPQTHFPALECVPPVSRAVPKNKKKRSRPKMQFDGCRETEGDWRVTDGGTGEGWRVTRAVLQLVLDAQRGKKGVFKLRTALPLRHNAASCPIKMVAG